MSLHIVQDALASLGLYNLLLIGILLLLTIRTFKRPRNLPPGPWGFPIVGVIPRLGKESYLTLTKWAREYGSVFSMRLGGKTIVVLNDLEVAKEALVKNANHCSDRPVLLDVKIGLTIPGSLVFENGPVWKERRRWMLGAFRNFGVGKRSLENKINEEARYMCQEIETKAVNQFDPFHAVNNAVSNIICSISFGERFDYADKTFEFLLSNLNDLFRSISQVSPANFFPFLWYTPYRAKERKSTKTIRTFVVDIVNRHKKTFDPNDIRDMIDHYLAEINRQKEEGKEIVFNADLIWRGIQDLFQAGTETTTSTMVWLILYMLHYPEVQEKAQVEIEEVFGRDRTPSWADRNELPYVRALIMEVQRHCTLLHSNVPRCTNAEIKLKGYTIPANTPLLLNAWSVHHDPNFWNEPYKFNPMRHIEDDGKTIKKNDAFIPFGLGDRVCTGQNLARMELFLMTINLLQRFTFKVPGTQPAAPLTDVVVGVVRCPKPFCVSVLKN